MHSVKPEDLSPRDSHRLLTSLFIPRPIAFVGTIGLDGTPNCAPFSFANGVAATILARTLVNNNTQISILQIATSSGLTTKNIDPLTNRFIRKT